jgi:antitoxin (DNA-binding transcriptional repressor) of toxin-antitoxin stability system
MTRTINAAAFKAKCLALIDQVAESGEPLSVTKRGKAKVQIVAVREKPKTLLGATRGTFQIVGDIVGPIFDEWDEEREWRNINGQFDEPPSCGRPGFRQDSEGRQGKGAMSRSPQMNSRFPRSSFSKWPGGVRRQDARR